VGESKPTIRISVRVDTCASTSWSRSPTLVRPTIIASLCSCCVRWFRAPQTRLFFQGRIEERVHFVMYRYGYSVLVIFFIYPVGVGGRVLVSLILFDYLWWTLSGLCPFQDQVSLFGRGREAMSMTKQVHYYSTLCRIRRPLMEGQQMNDYSYSTVLVSRRRRPSCDSRRRPSLCLS
jgi:hypothetical protein